MPQYSGQNGGNGLTATNGYSNQNSPNSSHLSSEGQESTLISRTQKQHTTQQVTTTTKTIREVQYLGPDGQPLDMSQHGGGPPPVHPRLSTSSIPQGLPPNYEQMNGMMPTGYDPRYPPQLGYGDYEQYAPNNGAPPPPGTQYPPNGGTTNYAEYPHRAPTPPSPSDRSASPPPQHREPDYLRQGSGSSYPPRSGYDELDTTLMPPRPGEPYSGTGGGGGALPVAVGPGGVQWRDPDLHEVIDFLNNPNNVIKANAAAYLQHLCYMDDPVKAKTRQLGGIPPLVQLLANDIPEIHRNACGALRNLSYGRQNDENKRAIKNSGGVSALVRLLRKTGDNEVKELVSGVLWNLSSCDDLKRAIIDEALLVLVNIVIIPHSGWEPNGPGKDTAWTTVFRNSSGILRNVSSAGDYGRKKLRECEGLVDSVLFLVKRAIEKANIDNKSVENCVCVLRNLSYRAQEVEDPNYDKKQLLTGESRAGAKPTSDNLGCFGASKAKKKDASQTGGHQGSSNSNVSSRGPRTGPVKGMDLLWQPEVVLPYLNLLSNCSNPETLEAAAGAIQNLSACYWQPSIDVRAAVRKDKGLPILVELLRMEVDRVVCAVATALRNLAIDQRNKELIGKYAMRDLVQKLPSGNPQQDHGTSDDTIAAVLATLNEVIKKHPEFSRSLLEAGGVERLMTITRKRNLFSSRVIKFASQVLYSMWLHVDLREVYRKAGWKEQDFITRTIAARNAARPNSPTNMNSTLNRPMASQSGTRYEDRTIQRGQTGMQHANNSMHYRPEDVPMENLSLYGRSVAPPAHAAPAYQHQPNHHAPLPGEPVYAQVNRDKKKNSRVSHQDNNVHVQQQQQQYPPGYHDYADGGGGGAADWHVVNQQGMSLDQQQQQINNQQTAAGGDSWV